MPKSAKNINSCLWSILFTKSLTSFGLNKLHEMSLGPILLSVPQPNLQHANRVEQNTIILQTSARVLIKYASKRFIRHAAYKKTEKEID